METSSPTNELTAGLTLYLVGTFDPRVFLEGLALEPIRYEQASDNSVTVLHKNKAPYRFVPNRKIERDQVKFSVPGQKSILSLLESLLAALAGLTPEVRAAWDALSERTADLGVYWTNCSNCGTEYDIPDRIVKALGDARITLRISVYATSDAIDKALLQRSEMERDSQDSQDEEKAPRNP